MHATGGFWIGIFIAIACSVIMSAGQKEDLVGFVQRMAFMIAVNCIFQICVGNLTF